MQRDTTSFSGSSISEHYDSGLGPMIFVDYAEDMARRANALNPKRVLETAAGTGIVSRRLRDRLPPAAQLVSTDLSPAMLEVAKAKFKSSEQISFQPADAMALPFDDASFDTVVCQFDVMFYPDKDKSYREVHRVLAPGGRYLFSVWDAHQYNPFGRLRTRPSAASFRTILRSFRKFRSLMASTPSESLIAAGFADIAVEVVRFEKAIGDGSPLARGLVFGAPLGDQIRARGLDPEKVMQAILTEFHREFGNPGKMPLQAMVFSATRPS